MNGEIQGEGERTCTQWWVDNWMHRIWVEHVPDTVPEPEDRCHLCRVKDRCPCQLQPSHTERRHVRPRHFLCEGIWCASTSEKLKIRLMESSQECQMNYYMHTDSFFTLKKCVRPYFRKAPEMYSLHLWSTVFSLFAPFQFTCHLLTDLAHTESYIMKTSPLVHQFALIIIYTKSTVISISLEERIGSVLVVASFQNLPVLQVGLCKGSFIQYLTLIVTCLRVTEAISKTMSFISSGLRSTWPGSGCQGFRFTNWWCYIRQESCLPTVRGTFSLITNLTLWHCQDVFLSHNAAQAFESSRWHLSKWVAVCTGDSYQKHC